MLGAMRSAAAIAETDPVLAAFENAPVGEPFPPELRAELDERMEDVAAGRVQMVDHDDVPAWLEQHARERIA
jgi:hypothetical protein